MDSLKDLPSPKMDQRVPLSEVNAASARERTLGFEAMMSFNTHAIVIESMSMVEPDSSEYTRLEQDARYHHYMGSQYALDERKRLAKIDPELDARIDTYFNKVLPKYMLGAMKYASEKSGREFTWRELLARDDDLFLNVLQFHNQLIEQQTNNEVVQHAFEEYRNRFLIAAQSLYDEGHLGLPPKEIDDPSVAVGDIFDTVLKECAGYYVPGKTEVVVMQGEGKTPEERAAKFVSFFSQTLIHEFVHLYLNTTLYRLESPAAVRWFNEAETEEIARKIREKMGEFDEADDEIYLPERDLLDALVSYSPNQVESKRLGMRAASGTDHDRQIFIEHVDALWDAQDVIDKIEEAINSEETRIVAALGIKKNRGDQAEAVIGIRMQLQDDPEAILRTVADKVIENSGKVAQKNSS